jgi:REP element-mobilizing transposase RayT
MLVPKRQTLRLKGYDYTTPGYYFVTMSTAGYHNLFGSYTGKNQIQLSALGIIAKEVWKRNDAVYENFRNDLYCIMPNHIHALVLLEYYDVNSAVPPDLSRVIRSFKGCVTKEARQLLGNPNLAIWQKNYHEKIVNSEASLNQIRRYILYNPLMLELKRDGHMK